MEEKRPAQEEFEKLVQWDKDHPCEGLSEEDQRRITDLNTKIKNFKLLQQRAKAAMDAIVAEPPRKLDTEISKE